MDTVTNSQGEQVRRLYRSVWRWHFYAGLFSIPLILWLSVTGAIYLFKPQIERWLDRPYDHLAMTGPRAAPEAIANAALDSVPNSSLHAYELPPSREAAVRVLVGVGTEEYRVYVHPQTLQILKVVNEDARPMRVLFHLHGELLAGDNGSRVVELAASWAIVLLVTGLYLWWPREAQKLAGVLWIRLGKGKRIFWRDLHAVTGVWISGFALFLLLTGLPWAKGWGSYFKAVRKLTGTAVAQQDWTTGRSSELAARQKMNPSDTEHSDHQGHRMARWTWPGAYSGLNVIVPVAESWGVAAPVLVQPPMKMDAPWTVKSDAQNRPLRTTLTVDPRTAAVLRREDFGQRQFLDRVVGTGVAAHEGQLFGLANQLLGLATAVGLVLLCVSSIVLWLRRRPQGVLGVPLPFVAPRWSFLLWSVVIALGVYLPEMAASLLLVLATERWVLRRIPAVSRWLGLTV